MEGGNGKGFDRRIEGEREENADGGGKTEREEGGGCSDAKESSLLVRLSVYLPACLPTSQSLLRHCSTRD
jgi:hypothetical protein